MIIVKHTEEDWIGYVSEESWNSELKTLMVSGDFEYKGRKVDGRIIARNKLELVGEETIIKKKGFINPNEVCKINASVEVEHVNGSRGHVFFEDWHSDQDPIFVRDITDQWTVTEDMVPHEITVDKYGNAISGYLIERTNLRNVAQ